MSKRGKQVSVTVTGHEKKSLATADSKDTRRPQECGEPLESEKGKGMSFPLETPEGTRPY